jgi:hypothetical protein
VSVLNRLRIGLAALTVITLAAMIYVFTDGVETMGSIILSGFLGALFGSSLVNLVRLLFERE